MYSINPILQPYSDKKGQNKVIIQVIYNRMKVYAPTQIKVQPDHWSEGVIVKHINKTLYNNIIKEQKAGIEQRLLAALRVSPKLSKEELTNIAKDTGKLNLGLTVDYIEELQEKLKGKLSKGRLSHYSTIKDQLIEYSPKATFSDISVSWLNEFERWLRKQPGRKPGEAMDNNTIQAKMSLFKGILNKAVLDKHISKEAFEGYKVPLYKQKLPAYLTESEMQQFYEALQLSKPSHKLAGYYFLLGCYAGYRISDMKRFNYDEMVKDGRLRLRAKKNGQIVTLLIHTRLQKVIDYIKDKPLLLSEDKIRDYVKDTCRYIGIRAHKVHDARHSFGMLLAESGFSLEEAAELLGDSTNITKVYFRMTNKRIDEKVKERLG